MEISGLMPLVQVFLLVVFRITGLMVMAPFFGSMRIPKRVKVLITVILAAGIAQSVPMPASVPQTPWSLAVGIGGEMVFGMAMGTAASFIFIAAQWAGEIIGQQMGINISEVFDPQFGQQGSLVGDLYYMLMLIIFLSVQGHHALLMGVRESFDALPLMSLGVDANILDMLLGMLSASTNLALQLAAPMLLTMLVLDLALGLIGRSVPQLNVMTIGLTLRSYVGMFVLMFGLALASSQLRTELLDNLQRVRLAWSGYIG